MISTAFLLALVSGLQVVNVHDGDTVLFRTGEGFEVRGRLMGIDCPEVPYRDRRGRKKSTPGQPLGEEARVRLEALLNEPFQIKTFGSDAFGRSLVLIQRGSKESVNEVLVREGFCEVYGQARKTKGFDVMPLEEAERKAKSEKLGVWGLKGYESPAQYRKRHRN